MRRTGFPLILGLICAAAALPAQEVEKPLSVIDWLGQQPDPVTRPPTGKQEPAVAATGTAPEVTTTRLSAGRPREIGLVPAQITGLPSDLWVGSDVDRVIPKLDALPDLHLPAAQALLFTVLLAEAQAPNSDASAGDRLALARVAKLVDLGALEPALSLIEQAGVRTSPAHFDLYMRISLLTGTEDRACTTLRAAPHLTREYGNRILCAGRAGQWEDAALTLGSAQALGLMPEDRLDLLDRFLNPDLFEDAAPPRPPRKMDPLTFRLFETIGEPLPTSNLPRAYAVANLRDVAGWKSQLEAAERLTRAGALPDNRLLGLYSERRAAASGGIWDRVIAVQRFDTALRTKSPDAIAKTLPDVWRQMKDAGLAVSFANLFAEDLAQIPLEGRTADLAIEVGLLSTRYEATASAAPKSPDTALLRGIAMGEIEQINRFSDPIAAALYDGFTTAEPPADLTDKAGSGQLGRAILDLLSLIDDGTEGDTSALSKGIAGLRAIGLEDSARRIGLQLLLTDE